jgi:hypothetical protein
MNSRTSSVFLGRVGAGRAAHLAPAAPTRRTVLWVVQQSRGSRSVAPGGQVCVHDAHARPRRLQSDLPPGGQRGVGRTNHPSLPGGRSSASFVSGGVFGGRTWGLSHGHGQTPTPSGRGLAACGFHWVGLHKARHVLAAHDGLDEFGETFRGYFPGASTRSTTSTSPSGPGGSPAAIAGSTTHCAAGLSLIPAAGPYPASRFLEGDRACRGFRARRVPRRGRPRPPWCRAPAPAPEARADARRRHRGGGEAPGPARGQAHETPRDAVDPWWGRGAGRRDGGWSTGRIANVRRRGYGLSRDPRTTESRTSG